MTRLSSFRGGHHASRKQRGVALVIVLILLLVMTLLGLASMRGTLLEERMSANLLDRSLAFQAAEAALRDGEILIATMVANKTPLPTVGCTAGVCAIPVPSETTLDRWLDPAFTGWQNATADVGTLAVAPQFFVEAMGDAPNWPGCDREAPVSANCLAPRFRVTARSAAADRAQVTLQSSFAAP